MKYFQFHCEITQWCCKRQTGKGLMLREWSEGTAIACRAQGQPSSRHPLLHNPMCSPCVKGGSTRQPAESHGVLLQCRHRTAEQPWQSPPALLALFHWVCMLRAQTRQGHHPQRAHAAYSSFSKWKGEAFSKPKPVGRFSVPRGSSRCLDSYSSQQKSGA